MPATIATRDNDAVLGPRKDQLGGPGPRTKTINADEWNRVVDLLFAMQAEIGDTDGTTVDSLWEAVGGAGLLFELDTTTTADVAATTEAHGETGPGGTAPAGTLTPTGNVAAAWMASTKLLEFSANASHTGIHVRRILTGTLPAEGYILDVGIGHVDTLFTSHGIIMLAYQQHGDLAFTGLGLQLSNADGTLSLMAVGDDGSGDPHTPTFVAAAPSFGHTIGTFTRGPVRLVCEFRKLDGQTPAQWTLRVTVISLETTITSAVLSGAFCAQEEFSTPVTMDGWAPDRIGVGIWNNNATPEAGVIRLSHLRVYELGSAIPT